jgi:hypothetical protein
MTRRIGRFRRNNRRIPKTCIGTSISCIFRLRRGCSAAVGPVAVLTTPCVQLDLKSNWTRRITFVDFQAALALAAAEVGLGSSVSCQSPLSSRCRFQTIRTDLTTTQSKWLSRKSLWSQNKSNRSESLYLFIQLSSNNVRCSIIIIYHRNLSIIIGTPELREQPTEASGFKAFPLCGTKFPSRLLATYHSYRTRQSMKAIAWIIILI